MKNTNSGNTTHFTVQEKELLQNLLREEGGITLSAEVIDALAQNFKKVNYRRGESIIATGEIDNSFRILFEGIARRVYKLDKKDITEGFGVPGTIIISFSSWFNGQPAFSRVEGCCLNNVILQMSKGKFYSLKNRYPQLAKWYEGCLEHQLAGYEMHNAKINGSIKDRLISFIRHRPEIMKNVPLQVVASYLQITPQYLSRLRREIMKR